MLPARDMRAGAVAEATAHRGVARPSDRRLIMRRHLNTIYVTTENAWVRKDGENLVVEADGRELGRAPLHMLSGLVCFGRAGASPAALAACAGAGICVSLLDPNGRFLARVEGSRS